MLQERTIYQLGKVRDSRTVGLQGRPGMLQTWSGYRLLYAPRSSEDEGRVVIWTCGFFQ
jgi:hypothetical protein